MMTRPAYWHDLAAVTFEATPCGPFLGVRLNGEVVGTLSPSPSAFNMTVGWRAHGKGGAFHSATTLNECVGWMIAHRDRLAREER